jgi:hypothetical protein
MNDQEPNNLTKLERLSAVLRDEGIEPEKMDAAQMEQYLKANKVDMSGPQKRYAAVLKKAKARQSLERAQARRLLAVDKAKDVISSGAEAVDVVRQKVRRLIEALGQQDPDQAQIYAREFEKATPEDLKVLEEDLTLLEIADDERDKQDPR